MSQVKQTGDNFSYLNLDEEYTGHDDDNQSSSEEQESSEETENS